MLSLNILVLFGVAGTIINGQLNQATNNQVNPQTNGQLDQPTNIRLIRYLTGGVEIQWDNGPSARNSTTGVTYLVQYKRLGELNWRFFETVTRPLYLIPLMNGQTYQLQIRANTNSQASSWSELFTFTMPGQSPSQALISPPTNLQVAVVSPTSVHLRWTSVSPLGMSADMYYVVLMQEQIPNTNTFGGDRLVYVKSRTFLLEQLQMALTYKFQVKIHMGHDESPYSESVTVKMPRESELFAVSNVSVSYSDDAPGFVNLSWFVPDMVKREVTSYAIWFSTVKESDVWTQQFIDGNEPKTTIGQLPLNTIIYFSIETHLKNGVNTESNVFQFRTPVVTPIENVNVVYTQDVSTLRLQWQLRSDISKTSVAGYEIILSKNNLLPEPLWNRFIVQGSDPILVVQNLDPASRYYAKINIRLIDGSTIPGSTTYQFVTLDQQSAMLEHTISVAYQRLSPNAIKLKWAFPNSLQSLNTTDQEWMKIMVPDNRTEVLITGLMNNTSYFVKILPRNSSMTMPMDSGVFRISPSDPLNQEIRSELTMPSKVDDMTVSSSQQAQTLCLRACHGSGDCATNERCIMIDGFMGFCIPEVIVKAIKP